MTVLKKIEWGQEFILGNKKLDQEHRELINIHNKLVDLINNNEETRIKIAEILSELSDAGLRHFQAEEQLMDKADYPNSQEHKHQHRDFIYNISLYNVNLMEDHPPEAEEIVQYLHEWWFQHIKKHDTDLEAHLKNKHSR